MFHDFFVEIKIATLYSRFSLVISFAFVRRSFDAFNTVAMLGRLSYRVHPPFIRYAYPCARTTTIRIEHHIARFIPTELPKSWRECITHQRIRSSNILSCWMLERRDYNTLPIRRRDRHGHLTLFQTSDFISHIGLSSLYRRLISINWALCVHMYMMDS